MLAPALAIAASGAGNRPPLTLSPFAVTGTYLGRAEDAQPLPITILTEDDIRTRGAATPAEWLSTLPQASRVPITESQASGADARGDIATVSLRGLGSGNTLVLLNGRRLAPHPISMPEGTSGVPSMATNINALPAAARAQTEFLRDGASALYGTDAIAGVINLIVRHDDPGTEVRTRFLEPQHGGGREYRATLAGGARSRRGGTSLAWSYDYLRRDEIRNTQRDFARTADFRARAPAPWNGAAGDPGVDLRSDRGFYGRFQRGTVNADGTVSGARPAGVTAAQVAANGTFYFVPTAAGAGTRALQATEPDRAAASPDAGYYLNVNEFRFLIPSTRRHTLHASLKHALPAGLTWFSEATFYRADSRNQREATRVDAVADSNITVSVDNPYNPFGSRFYSPAGAPNADGTARLTGTPSTVVLTRVTLPEFGPRRIDVRSETARVVTGLRGTFLETWNWETALLYAAAKTTDRESGAIQESGLRNALARTTLATALNPFMTTFAVANGALTTTGAPFTNPESVVAPLRGTFFREGRTTLGIWDFRVNGRLGELPGGPIRAAAGGELRRESYVDFREPESGRLTAADVQRLGLRPSLIGDNNYIQISPSDNTDAHREVRATFTEIALPIHRNRQREVLRSLELTVAARVEHAGDFGHVTRPKFGLSSRILPWATLRASVSEAFRAPNLAALHAGAMQRSITGISDAFRFAVTGSSDDGPTARRVSLRTADATLAPEKARTYNAGLVLEPAALEGLAIAVDIWSLRQVDALTRLDAPDLVVQDIALLTAASAASPATPIAQVDLSAAGSPNILRDPVTPADRELFAAYNAGRPRSEQRAAVGAIRTIAETYLNASRRNLAGVDLQVAWRSTKSPLGSFSAMLEAAYLHRFDEQLKGSSPRTDLSWRDGNTKWKGSLTLHWRRGDWAAGAFTSYTGRTQDSFVRTTTFAGPGVSPDGFLIVGRSWLTNLSVTRDFGGTGLLGGSSVRLGVNNAFDAEPPFGLGASSDTDGYLRGFGDPRGRTFSVEFAKRF